MPCGVGRRQGSALSLPAVPLPAGLELRAQRTGASAGELLPVDGRAGLCSVESPFVFTMPFVTSPVNVAYQP